MKQYCSSFFNYLSTYVQPCDGKERLIEMSPLSDKMIRKNVCAKYYNTSNEQTRGRWVIWKRYFAEQSSKVQRHITYWRELSKRYDEQNCAWYTVKPMSNLRNEPLTEPKSLQGFSLTDSSNLYSVSGSRILVLVLARLKGNL